jgi:hypothetical protein
LRSWLTPLGSLAALAKDSLIADWLIFKYGKATAAVHAIGILQDRLQPALLEALLSRGAVVSRFHLQLFFWNRRGVKVLCTSRRAVFRLWGRDTPLPCKWVLLEHAWNRYQLDPFVEAIGETDEIAAIACLDALQRPPATGSTNLQVVEKLRTLIHRFDYKCQVQAEWEPRNGPASLFQLALKCTDLAILSLLANFESALGAFLRACDRSLLEFLSFSSAAIQANCG